MDTTLLEAYWAPILAALIALAVAGYCLAAVYGRSARARLRSRLGELRQCRRRLAATSRVADRAASRVQRLQARPDSIKPRLRSEAEEALADALALQKIAHDQLLIAENQVRKVIVEEYPPRRHDALREKYLPDPAIRRQPFTF